MQIITGKYNSAKVMLDTIEESTLSQIYEFLGNPYFSEGNIAIMPDCHAGNGAVVGFTMPLPSSGKVIPSVIGVDIACGMLCQIIDNPKITMEELDTIIRKNIPLGTNIHDKKPALNVERNFPWEKASKLNEKFCQSYREVYGIKIEPTKYNYEWFKNKCNQIGMDLLRACNSIGTLGSGNHYLEVGKSNHNNYFLTIHSGSRQFGKCIAEYWQSVNYSQIDRKALKKKFNQEVEKIRKTVPKTEIANKIAELKKETLPVKTKPSSLEVIEGDHAKGYLTDMLFCQIYASENRRQMMRLIIEEAGLVPTHEPIETVHNYIDLNDFIIRKGAVAAYKGLPFILPFNMEDGMYICEGLSNEEWNFSAPHGAGRLFSRATAKATLSIEKATESMKNKNIFSSNIPLDEVKEAYKSKELIEEAIKPTAVILERIKPLLNIKE